MLHRENTRLDAQSLGRDRSLWHRITRTQAVQLCRIHPVAVLFQTSGQDAASWFDPGSRFFRSDSPYSYDGLRYFLLTGAGAGPGRGNAAGMAGKAAPQELEPLEFEDQSTGEMRSLGSPASKAPKTPAGQKTPGLSAIPAQPSPPGSGSAGLSALSNVPEVPEVPSIPEVPEVPEVPGIPDLPTLKEGFAIPVIPENPEVPELPLDSKGNPLSPAPKEKHPIEIQLLGLDGNPLKNAPFRLSLPDGSVEEGETDAEGRIRFPDNEVQGEMELVLPDFAEGA